MFTTDFGQSRIMKAYAQVVVKGMKFIDDGVTPYGLRWNVGGEEFGTCIVEDCDFLDFRLCGLHMDNTNHTDTLIVNNCLFKSIEDSTLDLALELNSPAVGAASDGSNLGDPRWGTWDATGVAHHDNTPKSFYLSQNYPNPFNPETSITYSIAQQTQVKLYIYNVLGQRITTLVNTLQPANGYTVTWNGKDENGTKVTSRVYFYRLEAGDFVSVKKMLYLR